MTKKILLKWLEARKAEALAQVDTQETAAKAALLAEKLERTKFAEMVAYVEPRLTEVYNYMMDWHKKNEELAGPLSMSWGRLSACWARLAESVRTAVMSAVCAYADQANIEESGGPVSSETNDGISRTYVTGSASSASASKNAGTAQGRLSNAIRLYLAPTGLLFRGRGRR